jgi:hypothetical protein
MKRSTRQRIEFAQHLLFSAAVELKALNYDHPVVDDVITATQMAESRIDSIVAELNKAKAVLPTRERGGHQSFLKRVMP